jgi:DHA1 family bicyclomycin/chloramphenicol resistance-like MFS transporter
MVTSLQGINLTRLILIHQLTLFIKQHKLHFKLKCSINMTRKAIDSKIINIGTLGPLLLLASSIVRVGACLYLPALPIIGKDLSISDSDMSLTIMVYFIVFALFILIIGPLSDAFGRKYLILVGAVVFIVGSAICGISYSFTALLMGRIVQAVGASMIPGTSRAMIRDAASDTQVVSLLGWMAVLGGVLMVAAPILGGVITEHYGWRCNFWVLAGFTLIILVVIAIHLPETLLNEDRIRLDWIPVANSYKNMILSSRFFMVMLPVSFCFMIQGVYLAVAPFIFIKSFAFTPTHFGLSNIAIVVALAAGRFLSIGIIKRHSSEIAYVVGGVIVLIAGAIFAVVIINEYENAYALLTGISVFGVGFGIVSPVGLKSSITAFRQTSGMAAALQGGMVLGGTAVGSAGIAIMLKCLQDISPMRILSISVTIIAFATFISVLTAKNKLV